MLDPGRDREETSWPTRRALSGALDGASGAGRRGTSLALCEGTNPRFEGGHMKRAQFEDLLFQSLEHEKGGVLVYKAALQAVQNEDLKEEFEKYLQQTEEHVQMLT